MKRIATALLVLIAAVGIAHAGSTNDEAARKAAQQAARLASQPAVNLLQITDGQFQPMRVLAPTANCDAATPDVVIHDDGELENGYGWNASANVGRINDKFTPASYPATISTVCAATVTTTGVTSFNMNVVVYDDDGTGGEPGTVLGTKTVVAHPATFASPSSPTLEEFDLSDLAIVIDSGSVYISVEWNAAVEPAGVFIGADESTSTSLVGGYMRANADPWAPIVDSNPDYRSLMIRAVMPAAVPGAPSLSKAFAPTQVLAGEISTLTITLRNTSQPTAAVLSADLVDTFPAGLLVAATPNVNTTCANGMASAVANDNKVTLPIGAEIPANGTCTVTVDVTAASDGSYQNTIDAGALETQHGSNANPASATLTVGYTFPEPYCPINFPGAVEPITHVLFDGIDNSSSDVVDGSPALENFTDVIGSVNAGTTWSMAVEGNTAGDFTTVITAYIDWNQDGDFDDADETFPIGSIKNSTGTDGQQAVANIAVPVTALVGDTRMRVTKKFLTAATPCNTSGYGQAEDYTLTVGPATYHDVTPSVGTPSGNIAPDTVQSVLEGDTTTFALTPDPGFKVGTVGGTCGGTLTGNSFETDPVMADCTVIANFAVAPLTLAKSFDPQTIDEHDTSTLTITLANPTTGDATLQSPLVDNLPAGLNASSATTNCGLILGKSAGGPVVNAISITLPAGIVLPAGSSCQIVATVNAAPGTYVNTLAAGALHTSQGDNVEPAEATLEVTGTPVIGVTPADLPATLVTNSTSPQTLAIANTGTDDLIWSIDEQPARAGQSGQASGARAARITPRTSTPRAPHVRDLAMAPMADTVQDGGFELGDPNPYWDSFSQNFDTVLCDASCSQTPENAPHAGSWWVWFGGIDAAETGYVSQDVTIDAASTALNFWVQVPSSSGLAGDYLALSVDGTELWRLTADAASGYLSAYQLVSVDVSSYADGATHTIKFDSAVVGGGVGISNFMLDDVSLGAGTTVSCQNPSDVPWLSVDQPTGTTLAAGSTDVTVTFDANGVGPGNYSADLCVASNDPVNPLVAVPVSMTVTASGTLFTVTPSIGTGTGTISPDTPQSVDENGSVTFTMVPGPKQQVANVGGTCGGTVNGNSFTTAPVAADCTVVADFEPLPFPLPYCSVDVSSDVEPISRVVLRNIDNPSDPTVNASPALENFLAVTGGNVSLGGTYSMAVEGNTNGNYTTKQMVYIDWNQNGLFTDTGESYSLSDLVDSDGTDGKQATGEITVPAGASLGETRMRVSKQFLFAPAPCGPLDYGQAEDYTIWVDDNPLPVPTISTDVFNLSFTAEVGGQATDAMQLSNIGETDSRLEYLIKRALAERQAASATAMDRGTVYNAWIAGKDRQKLQSMGFVPSLHASPLAARGLAGLPVTLAASDISQMADNSPGDEGVSCGVDDNFTGTADNSWWRRFYFDEHPEVGASTKVTAVTVSSGSVVAPGGLPITINLYTIPHSVTADTIDLAQLTLIGTATAVITDGLASITVPVEGEVTDTTDLDLVVEYHTDGNATGGQFFPGANATPQTHPTFLSSDFCGITTPTDAADPSIGGGFPDFHLTMVVSVEVGPLGVGCDNPSNVPWLATSPTSGAIMQGDSQGVAVTANAASLAIGSYQALLCVSSNDPSHPRLDIPVQFDVTPKDIIFQNGFEMGTVPGVYTDLASFQANFTGESYSNDFADLAESSGPEAAISYADSTTGIAYTIDTEATPDNLWFYPDVVTTYGSGDQLVILFTGAPVTAVGFNVYASDVSGAPVPGNQVVITLSDGTVETFNTADATDFRGFITPAPITKVTIDAPNPSDPQDGSWSTIENLVVGTAN